MTGLEQTFYIMGIVFMGLVFVMLIALVVAVFVIRAKVNKIHATIEEKVNQVTNFAELGGEFTAKAGKQVLKQAKKAIHKNKTKK